MESVAELNVKTPLGCLDVRCDICHDAGAVLTDEGERFLAVARPALGLLAAQPAADEDAVAY